MAWFAPLVTSTLDATGKAFGGSGGNVLTPSPISLGQTVNFGGAKKASLTPEPTDLAIILVGALIIWHVTKRKKS